MLKFTIMIVFITISNCAIAEWTMVAGTDEYTVYVDLSTIKQQDYFVKMWSLFDYKTTQTLDKIRFLSLTNETEYNCKEEKSRVIGGTSTGFSMNMGEGNNLGTDNRSNEWKTNSPGSIGKIRWEVACGIRKIK